MEYTTPKSDLETYGRLHKFEKKVSQLISKHKYSKDDVRGYLLETFLWFSIFSRIRFNLYSQTKYHKIPSKSVDKLLDVKNRSRLTVLEKDVKFTRIGFLIVLHFQIENFLKVLISKLEGKNAPENFNDDIEKIFKILNIKNSASKLNFFKVITYMRNSLHANGFHTKPSITLKIDNHKFKFEKGKKFNNASWPEIIFVLEHCIDVIDEILINKKIKKITEKLPIIYIPK